MPPIRSKARKAISKKPLRKLKNPRKKTSPQQIQIQLGSGLDRIPREFSYRMRQFIVALLLMVGIGFIAFPTVYTNVLVHPAAGKNSEPIRVATSLLGNEVSQEVPIRIVIPSLSIDIPVVEAPVINGYWQTSDTMASHGEGSGVPGQEGNDVIFAHARDGLFLPLRDIKKNAVVYVMTKTHWYQYKIFSTQLVDPAEVAVISPTKNETLTLYTCSGYFDEKRFIAVARR